MTNTEIARLKRLLRASPDSLRFVSLGEALRCRGELDAALSVLSRGLKYHPNLHSGQATLARVYAERGEPHRALALVTALMERDPGDVSLQVLMVELLIATGKRKKALAGIAQLPPTAPRHALLMARLKRPELTDPFATRELAGRLERAGRLNRAASVWDVIGQQEQDPDAQSRADSLRQRASRPTELEVVELRDERSEMVRASRPSHLRRLLALFRRAEQEM